jgi:hypothetical protein
LFCFFLFSLVLFAFVFCCFYSYYCCCFYCCCCCCCCCCRRLLPPLPHSYYLVGSGNTGAAAALGVMGMCYLATMLTSAFVIRRPHVGYTVVAGSSAAAAVAAPVVLPANVPADGAMRSPQFALLATSFFCLGTGGIGLMSVVRRGLVVVVV